MKAKRGILSGDWRSAALWAVLAVFLQALAFAAATPVRAAPSTADFPFALSAFCGTAPVATAGGTKKVHDPGTADCQLCPLCQALTSAGLSLAPRAPMLPMRSAVVLYRLAPVVAQYRSAIIDAAAQPRGPPSDSKSV
jgi:hypothetical protein